MAEVSRSVLRTMAAWSDRVREVIQPVVSLATHQPEVAPPRIKPPRLRGPSL